jgi:hypothetical protein
MPLKKYQELLKDLNVVRKNNKGFESTEEDNILEQMDSIWWTLTDEDHEYLQSLSPHILIHFKGSPA